MQVSVEGKREAAMDKLISRVAAIFMVVLLLPAPGSATCGGGGGGGTGGMRGGNTSPGGNGVPGNDEQVYPVPWKLVKPEDVPVAGGLAVYWFPSSIQEFQRSSLRNSRTLSLYASQCVSMGVADTQSPVGLK